MGRPCVDVTHLVKMLQTILDKPPSAPPKAHSDPPEQPDVAIYTSCRTDETTIKFSNSDTDLMTSGRATKSVLGQNLKDSPEDNVPIMLKDDFKITVTGYLDYEIDWDPKNMKTPNICVFHKTNADTERNFQIPIYSIVFDHNNDYKVYRSTADYSLGSPRMAHLTTTMLKYAERESVEVNTVPLLCLVGAEKLGVPYNEIELVVAHSETYKTIYCYRRHNIPILHACVEWHHYGKMRESWLVGGSDSDSWSTRYNQDASVSDALRLEEPDKSLLHTIALLAKENHIDKALW
jgi:hypothetical protein